MDNLLPDIINEKETLSLLVERKLDLYLSVLEL